MMKKMARLFLCSILILALVLSFSGCNEEKKILGSWKGNVDLSENVLSALVAEDEEMADCFSVDNFSFDIVFRFNEDGTYEMEVEEESAKKALEAFEEDLKKGFKKYVEKTIEKEGLDMTVEEFLEQADTTMDELVESALSEMPLESIVDSFNSEGNYSVKEGKLFTAPEGEEIDEDSYETYEIKDDKLTLLDVFGEGADDEGVKALYPMVFEKID